jgi:hypothetical protein
MWTAARACWVEPWKTALQTKRNGAGSKLPGPHIRKHMLGCLPVSSLDAELRLDASRVCMEWHISPFLSHACQHVG